MRTFEIGRCDEFIFDDFFEFSDFTIYGNKTYKTDWYDKAEKILNDVDIIYDYDDKEETYELIKELEKNYNISKEEASKIIKIVKDSNYKAECIKDILNVLYPDKFYVLRTIRGNVQSEYAEVLYNINDKNFNIRKLEDFYFGNITEVFDTKNGITTFYADSEIDKNNLIQFLKDDFGLSDDENFEIKLCFGFQSIFDELDGIHIVKDYELENFGNGSVVIENLPLDKDDVSHFIGCDYPTREDNNWYFYERWEDKDGDVDFKEYNPSKREEEFIKEKIKDCNFKDYYNEKPIKIIAREQKEQREKNKINKIER